MTDKEKRRDKYLQDNFNISLAEYNAILKFQNKVCAICGENLNKKGEPLILYVDHQHAGGLVRGALCFRCNKGLAFFKDNATSLARAAEYINHPPATTVLKAERFAYPGRVGTKKYRKLIKQHKQLTKLGKLGKS